jgi:hypothetical protein
MGICQASVARTGDVLCLTASQRLQLENRAEPVRKAVSQLRAAAESAIRERLERAVKGHDLPPGVDPASLARFVWTINLGIAVQAAGGANRAQLYEIVEVAMRRRTCRASCWPASRSGN